MKTVSAMKEIIYVTRSELVGLSPVRDRRKIDRISREIERYEQIMAYLETNPSEQYIVKQLEDLEKRKSSAESAINKFSTSDKDLRKSLSDNLDLPLIKRQIKTLRFILE